MTLKVRNLPHEKLEAIVSQYNSLVDALGTNGAMPHYAPYVDAGGEPADLVTTTDASDLDSSKALAVALCLAIESHGADTDQHSSADTIVIAAWASRPALPANLAEVQSIANEVKADINTHVAKASVHRGVGGQGGLAGTVAISTADASDQGTANTLLNACKATINLHARAGARNIRVVPS